MGICHGGKFGYYKAHSKAYDSGDNDCGAEGLAIATVATPATTPLPLAAATSEAGTATEPKATAPPPAAAPVSRRRHHCLAPRQLWRHRREDRRRDGRKQGGTFV